MNEAEAYYSLYGDWIAYVPFYQERYESILSSIL